MMGGLRRTDGWDGEGVDSKVSAAAADRQDVRRGISRKQRKVVSHASQKLQVAR